MWPIVTRAMKESPLIKMYRKQKSFYNELIEYFKWSNGMGIDNSLYPINKSSSEQSNHVGIHSSNR